MSHLGGACGLGSACDLGRTWRWGRAWRSGRARESAAAIRTAAAVAWIAGCSSPAATQVLAAGTHDLSLEIEGRERTYLLHLPPAVERTRPLPLVVAFHGGGGRAEGFGERSGLDRVSDREGFAIAYPDGTGRIGRRLLTWNAGGCCGLAAREKIDDVAFTRALVDDVARRLPIDRRRIYATGHSNGGMMAYRVGAEAPDLVAAIAPVGGAMIVEAFDTKTPVPVLHIHSVDDPRALYEGGLGPPFPLTRSRVMHNGVEAELARWVALNRCAERPILVDERSDPETGHGARHLRFAPCESGAPVELWKLVGPGHAWPGGEGVGRERLIGPTTTVISAAEEVWRFFSRFEKGS